MWLEAGVGEARKEHHYLLHETDSVPEDSGKVGSTTSFSLYFRTPPLSTPFFTPLCFSPPSIRMPFIFLRSSLGGNSMSSFSLSLGETLFSSMAHGAMSSPHRDACFLAEARAYPSQPSTGEGRALKECNQGSPSAAKHRNGGRDGGQGTNGRML